MSKTIVPELFRTCFKNKRKGEEVLEAAFEVLAEVDEDATAVISEHFVELVAFLAGEYPGVADGGSADL